MELIAYTYQTSYVGTFDRVDRDAVAWSQWHEAIAAWVGR